MKTFFLKQCKINVCISDWQFGLTSQTFKACYRSGGKKFHKFSPNTSTLMFLKPFKTQLSTQIKWTLQDKTNWGKWPLLTEFNFTVSAALEVAILSQKLANECLYFFFKTRVPALWRRVNVWMMLNCPIKFLKKAVNPYRLVRDAQNYTLRGKFQAAIETEPQNLGLTEKLLDCP